MARRLSFSRTRVPLVLILFFISGFERLAANAQTASERSEQPQPPLTVNCVSSPRDPKAGQDVIVGALPTSSLGRPLRYSFTTDAGKLTPVQEKFAVLSTSDLGAGVVHVTCQVADDEGRTASSTVTITLAARPPSSAASAGAESSASASGKMSGPAASSGSPASSSSGSSATAASSGSSAPAASSGPNRPHRPAGPRLPSLRIKTQRKGDEEYPESEAWPSGLST